MARTVEEWRGRTDDSKAPPRVFGIWEVLGYGGRSPSNKKRWLCRCACGTERPVLATHLLNGRSKSCGCDRPRKEQTQHGHPLYRAYCNIIQRCENPKNVAFANYGARGISMAPEWRNDFWKFVADVGARPTPAHTIEREDNSIGYVPGNCIWADRSTQMRNTRRNHIVTYAGRQMTLVEACELSGVKYGTAKWRLSKGISQERAFDAP